MDSVKYHIDELNLNNLQSVINQSKENNSLYGEYFYGNFFFDKILIPTLKFCIRNFEN
jgi:hypothetical protein